MIERNVLTPRKGERLHLYGNSRLAPSFLSKMYRGSFCAPWMKLTTHTDKVKNEESYTSIPSYLHVKFALEMAMKAQRRSRCTVLLFL
jgi:hypothetical protein